MSWNGGGFDLPVLHYRGMLHGVHAARYWDQGEDDREFKWNNYISRYHARHLDLMDLLAMYQPRGAAPLDQIAQLLGFPGKIGLDGAQVWQAWQDGKIAQIRSYCEADVANTYLVYLRFQLMRGVLPPDKYQQEIDLRARDARKVARRALARIPAALAGLKPVHRRSCRIPIRVESLDQEGRGVAHADGKVIFIEGALPGELVTYASYHQESRATNSRRCSRSSKPSADARRRRAARHFGVCGGCSQQHLDARAQVAAKQRVLEDNLRHIGKVAPGTHAAGDPRRAWGYRHRARFSARYVLKKGGALIGFREKRSSYVTDMTTLRSGSAAHLGAARAAARTDQRLVDTGPRAADRACDRRGHGRAGAAYPAAACGRRTRT